MKNTVFDWEEVDFGEYKEDPDERYWARSLPGKDPKNDEPVAEIEYNPKTKEYICDIFYQCITVYDISNYKNKKIFNNLNDAKEWADEILLSLGVKTLEDHYKVII
jgi:hypothetical protein